jgi:hypothetical protein
MAESNPETIYEDPAPLYFDSFAIVGPRGRKDPRELWRTEELVAEMEHCGVHGALVTHGLAREYDPSYGNSLLMEELEKSERLFGCWVLLPDHLGEMPEPAELVREMRRNGIVAGKIHPNTHRFALDERTCGPLLKALEAKRIPLLIDDSETDHGTISRLCEGHPGLPVLLQGYRHGNERMLYPLLDSFKNLYVEFSSLQANFAIELLVDRYGPERLLLGTEGPVKSLGAAKAFIDYADIGDEDRALIAGGNLARLLGVRPPGHGAHPGRRPHRRPRPPGPHRRERCRGPSPAAGRHQQDVRDLRSPGDRHELRRVLAGNLRGLPRGQRRDRGGGPADARPGRGIRHDRP